MKPSTAWLAVTIPVFAIALVLLIKTIRSLVVSLRESVVASMPLSPAQRARIADAGRFDLYVEGRLGTDFSGLDFEVRDAQGRAIPLEKTVFRARSTSMSGRVRLQLRSFDLPAPGEIELRVSGIHATSSPDNRIIISRPVRTTMVLHILALVGLGALSIGSIVASALLIAQPWRNRVP